MITAGIDIGGEYVKVLLLKNGEVLGRELGLGGFEQGRVAEELLEKVLKKAGISRKDVGRIGVTGSGRKYAPPHDVELTEIGASAKGACFLFPSARTVIDVGAEDSRAIKCEQGGVKDFATNDKCAAGTGTFVEAMARALEVKLEDFGRLSLQATKAIPINAQCAVFAESEVVSLIHAKESKEDIARAINDAIAERVAAMAKRITPEKDIVLVGGTGRNVGFVESLKRALGAEILVPDFPEFVAALGAALAAKE